MVSEQTSQFQGIVHHKFENSVSICDRDAQGIGTRVCKWGSYRRVKFSPGSGCLNLNVSGGEKPKGGTESNPVMNSSRDLNLSGSSTNLIIETFSNFSTFCNKQILYEET